MTLKFDGLEFSYYRKRGSACYIVREVRSVRERERERERDTERDGSDVTIVALKLAMSLNFPLQKFALGYECMHFPLQKNSHFSFLPSYFPPHPSYIVALKFAMSSHSPLPKTFALFVPTLSSGAIVLPIEKMNQINTKNYWK